MSNKSLVGMVCEIEDRLQMEGDEGLLPDILELLGIMAERLDEGEENNDE